LLVKGFPKRRGFGGGAGQQTDAWMTWSTPLRGEDAKKDTLSRRKRMSRGCQAGGVRLMASSDLGRTPRWKRAGSRGR